jgi:hypothetical protein
VRIESVREGRNGEEEKKRWRRMWPGRQKVAVWRGEEGSDEV